MVVFRTFRRNTMIESLRFLLFPFLMVVGWMVSARRAEVARRSVRLLSMIVATIFVIIVATGLARNELGRLNVHLWAGHAIVIAMWLIAPYSMGVALQVNLRRRPAFAILQVIIVILLLAAVLLASFSGYLAPSDVDGIAEETRNRFTVLHLVATPLLVAILLGTWCLTFRPHSQGATGQSGERGDRQMAR